MGFSDDWKVAKKTFETDTEKQGKKLKKPSEMLGPFRKGTGIDDALKKLDGAVAKKDDKTVKEAYDKLKVAADKYSTFLMSGKKDKQYDGFQKQLQALSDVLDDIVSRARTQTSGTAMAKELGAKLSKEGVKKKVETGEKEVREKELAELEKKVGSLTLGKMMVDNRLQKKLLEMADKQFWRNELDFVLKTAKSGSLSSKQKENIYNTYVIGSEEVNLSSGSRGPLDELAAQGEAGFKQMDFSEAHAEILAGVTTDKMGKLRAAVKAELEDSTKREDWRGLLHKL